MTLRSGWVAGWRLALRLAWRDAWRSKSRSVLVLVMVTFPVVAVIAADVAQATQSVSSVESLDRRLGSAQARVTTLPGVDSVFQTVDPDSGGYGAQGGRGPAASLEEVERALGGTRPAIELRTGDLSIRSDLGAMGVTATGLDLRSPLADGMFRLTSGRWPAGAHEVTVNEALGDRGYAVGDTITGAGGTRLTVVGTAESTDTRTAPLLLGDTSLLPQPGPRAQHEWLVGGAPVTWSRLRAANGVGAVVLSRDVVEHPPSTGQLPAQVRYLDSSSDRSGVYTVLLLVGVMSLLEVVLLAGPAFAVGARRHSRSLALIAANGGTPAQARRVILGTAVVIGAVSAAVGTTLGLVLGRALLPWFQSMSDTWFGPFQVRWTHLLGIAAFGLVSAVLAAVVPAWIASRQDVVAVLAGRRGDRAASRRFPVIGVVMVGVGIALAVAGARQGSGDTLISLAAIMTVIGMLFLVPMVVLGVARLGRRFPLPLRYAVRDAARHRTRTVPAVAAVAATVAGVVALSIGNTSDQAQARDQYLPQLAQGDTSIAMNGGRTDWPAVEAAVARIAPDAPLSQVVGVRGSQPIEVSTGSGVPAVNSFVSSLPTQALVSDGRTMPLAVRQLLPEAEWKRASAVLRRGGVVVFGRVDGSDPHATIRLGHGPPLAVPSETVGVGSDTAMVLGILSPSVARDLHMSVRTAGLLLTGKTLTTAQEGDLQQVLQGMDQNAYVYTERGYQVSGAEKIVLWILFGLAGVLMLGGTLTATFLALSDARPDLATLSAVGASPRMRRAVAAAYAVSVGVVGAALGAAVGLVPGIAITYPLTRPYNSGEPGPSHYLVIPWLEIAGLVVLLPLLTARVVGLLARSRLPLVARLD
jgi:putative ABC transport system permease protein